MPIKRFVYFINGNIHTLIREFLIISLNFNKKFIITASCIRIGGTSMPLAFAFVPDGKRAQSERGGTVKLNSRIVASAWSQKS